ncbi:hypothetical protein GN330_21665 [Nitratireductor sp. CAU 1489]|uniref:Uncharacterized protein n=1 Tax=Nitratireductor arenosus TaxID=2682096 RepID=A0A844QKN4_9HYPH|nr:hypothetical protein [Nitratireductor arenosus]MVA99865.1 hypothetical protein [Nitratireductor arenosus]
MTNIIQFQAYAAMRKSGRRRLTGTAAIVVFPGVRYERQRESGRQPGPGGTKSHRATHPSAAVPDRPG